MRKTFNAQLPTSNVQLRKRFAVAISLRSGRWWNPVTKREWAGSLAVYAARDDKECKNDHACLLI
jgi:hypothetical protein